MKTQKILQSPIAKQMYDLKVKSTLAIIRGECKVARTAQKEFAKLAVDNFNTAINTPNPVRGSFPLFSRTGLNCVKYMIFKAFTKKTPEEKKFKSMYEDFIDSAFIHDVH